MTDIEEEEVEGVYMICNNCANDISACNCIRCKVCDHLKSVNCICRTCSKCGREGIYCRGNKYTCMHEICKRCVLCKKQNTFIK